jgi:hypothetical protein
VVVAVVPCGPIYKPDGQMGTGTLAKASFSSQFGRKTLYQNSCNILFVFGKNYPNFD